MSAATGRTTIVFDRMIAKPGPYFFQSKKPSSPDLRFASRDGDCDHLAPFLGRQNEKDRARAWHPQKAVADVLHNPATVFGNLWVN
jgi:hypothetical protein